MRVQLLLACVLSLPLLAGCASEPSPGPDVIASEDQRLELGGQEGAIEMLIVDDRFRPLSLGPGSAWGGSILLLETGELYATDVDGVLRISGLPAMRYTFYLDVEGLEAVPHHVEVETGEYAESVWMARRIVSSLDSPIFVEEFTFYQGCAAQLIVTTMLWDCLMDGSMAIGNPRFMGLEAIHGIAIEYEANHPAYYGFSIACNAGASSRICGDDSLGNGTTGRTWMVPGEGPLILPDQIWEGQFPERFNMWYEGSNRLTGGTKDPNPLLTAGFQMGMKARVYFSQFLEPTDAEAVGAFCIACQSAP